MEYVNHNSDVVEFTTPPLIVKKEFKHGVLQQRRIGYNGRSIVCQKYQALKCSIQPIRLAYTELFAFPSYIRALSLTIM